MLVAALLLSVLPAFSSEEVLAPYEKTDKKDRYRAQVVEVMDGDTIRANIELGFGISMQNTPIRLLGVWAPEKFGTTKVDGLKAKKIAQGKVRPGDRFVLLIDFLRPHEKYGRVLGIIITSDGENLNKELQTSYVKIWGPPVSTTRR